MTHPMGPLQRVVERLAEGAGSDTLLLGCGHTICRDHQKTLPGRVRCFRCRSEQSIKSTTTTGADSQ
jgi:hypothetical protein